MKKTGRLSIMKKALLLVLLLSGLLLYGCGVGGGTSATSGGSNTSNPGGSQGGPQPQIGAAQSFTLHLIDAEKTNVALATTFTNTITPVVDSTPDKVRVVVRLNSRVTSTYQDCVYPEYDAEGNGIGTPTCTDIGYSIDKEVYKAILDKDYAGSGTVSVSIPASTGFAAGYTIDVITSKGTPTHNILKYGQAINVQVDAINTDGTVVISDVGRQLNMQVADTILSSSPTQTVQFNVTVKNGLPFASAWSADMTFNGTTSTKPSSSNSCSFDAPNSGTGATVQIKGHFTLQDTFLTKAKDEGAWIRDFPYLSDESITYNLNPLISVTIL